MSYKIQNITAGIFTVCIAVLTLLCIFSIWQIVSSDILVKSLETIGIVAVAALIVMISAKAIDSHKAGDQVPLINNTEVGVAVFRAVRKFTVTVLIVAVSFAALLGIMAIWDAVPHDVLYKSLSSMAIIAFSSGVIIVVCLEREGSDLLRGKSSQAQGGQGTSGATNTIASMAGSMIVFIVVGLLLLWIVVALMGGFR